MYDSDICKYIGKYRVLAEYDKGTNDWVRDDCGNIDETFEDFYIPFKNGKGRVESYSTGVVIFHFFDIDFARDVTTNIKHDYHTRDLVKKGVVINACKTDAETIYHVKEKYIPSFLKYVKLETKGKDIKPFDDKNLPNPYKIPKKDLSLAEPLMIKYREKGNFLLENITRKFITTVLNTPLQEFRETKLTFYAFIHQKEMWGKYLEFLKKNIK